MYGWVFRWRFGGLLLGHSAAQGPHLFEHLSSLSILFAHPGHFSLSLSPPVVWLFISTEPLRLRWPWCSLGWSDSEFMHLSLITLIHFLLKGVIYQDFVLMTTC